MKDWTTRVVFAKLVVRGKGQYRVTLQSKQGSCDYNSIIHLDGSYINVWAGKVKAEEIEYDTWEIICVDDRYELVGVERWYEMRPQLQEDIKVHENGWEKESTKDGKVKTMFQLFDPFFYEGVSEILTLGAQKYKPNNWINGSHEEYSRAVESHWNEYKKGNRFDKESGKSHLYHIACNLMFLDYFDREDKGRPEVDGRLYLKG